MKKYWQPFIIVLLITCIYIIGYIHGNNTAIKIYVTPINDTISKIDTSYNYKYD